MAEGPATVSLESSDQTQSTGRVTRLTEKMSVVKSRDTGKLEVIDAKDMNQPEWIPLPDGQGLVMIMDKDTLCNYGRKLNDETQKEKLVHLLTQHCRTDLMVGTPQEGLKWDTAMFSTELPHDEEEPCQVGKITASDAKNFIPLDMDNLIPVDVPLQNLSQCTVAKDKINLLFHLIDDVPFEELRLVPCFPRRKSACDITDPQSPQMTVLEKAKRCGATEDAIAVFWKVRCFGLGGICDIKVFQTFFQLHGDTFYYKILMSNVCCLHLLPHNDGSHTYFVISLGHPINYLGLTYYNFLVFFFGQEEVVSIELPLSEEELKTKYAGRLTKKLSGPKCDVIGQIMEVMVNQEITRPAQQFLNHSGGPAIKCTYKEQAGYLYLLDRGLIFLHKPCIHTHVQDIINIILSNSEKNTYSSFQVKTKGGAVYTFSEIQKEDYGKLVDFIAPKNLHCKDKPFLATGEFGNSGHHEDKPDAVVKRVEDEGKDGECNMDAQVADDEMAGASGSNRENEAENGNQTTEPENKKPRLL